MSKKARVGMRVTNRGSNEYFVVGTELLRVVRQKDGVCRLKAGAHVLMTSRGEVESVIREMVSFYHELRIKGFDQI